MEEAYREYVHLAEHNLLASADAAVRTLAARGTDHLPRHRAHARLKAALAERLPDLDHLDDPEWHKRVHADHVAACDLVKTDGGLSRLRLSATTSPSARRAQESSSKAGVHTSRLNHHLPARARRGGRHSRRAATTSSAATAAATRASDCRHPFSAIAIRPVIHPYLARRTPSRSPRQWR